MAGRGTDGKRGGRHAVRSALARALALALAAPGWAGAADLAPPGACAEPGAALVARPADDARDRVARARAGTAGPDPTTTEGA
ncbi:MAG: hypothetical protein R3263_06745, partial [Myxococcota bacterium]|nr:hypothetical protein [Myxococcota bacterium]